MANTFKVVTFAAEPASAGTAYTMYTVASSTTTVVLGLILTNIHTSAVTVEVELVSDTGNRNGANNVANGTAFLAKDVVIPAGTSLELLSGGKVVMETTDVLKIDCSVADKVSGTLSIMEITLDGVYRYQTSRIIYFICNTDIFYKCNILLYFRSCCYK